MELSAAGSVAKERWHALPSHHPEVQLDVSRLARSAGCDEFEWQRGYYERIVRSEASLYKIRKYIEDNPLRWAEEKEMPNTELPG